MPKNSKAEKRDGRVFKARVPSRLRIGGRKSGKSAHSMTNEALLAVLENKAHAKTRQNAITVLRLRGVAVA